MVLFALGLVAGLALGVLVVGFLAMRAYDRGVADALGRRKYWRTELVHRQAVAAGTLQQAARKAS